MSEKTGETAPKTGSFLMPVLVLAIIVLAGVVLFQNFFSPQQGTITGLEVIENPVSTENEPTAITNANLSSFTKAELESDILRPQDFAVREEYFKEVYRIKRNTYNLFEKAAIHLGKNASEIPGYFFLGNEQEIFSELPKPAEDFSEIAYLFASGKYFTIGFLGPEYYKQPELFPNFKSIGLRYYTRPDPSNWVTNGYGTYPSEQSDTLKKGGREEFTGVVFVHSAWGVQTFQGLSIQPSAETLEHFDIDISYEDDGRVVNGRTFLLEPTFPKFYKNWAYKVIIDGKLKPDTLPGQYRASFNVEVPPKEKQEEWQFEHRSIYQNAAFGIKPTGPAILFNIQVQ